MAKTFELFQTHADGSDCTAPYRLNIIGTPSVDEVVADILSREEWGSITVYSDRRKEKVCGMYYDHNTTANTMTGYNNHIVISGNSVGGWSNMDYVLHIR